MQMPKTILNPTLKKQVKKALKQSRLHKKTSKSASSFGSRRKYESEADDDDGMEEGEDLLNKSEATTDEISVNFRFCDAAEDDEPWVRALIGKGWTGHVLSQDEMKIRSLAQASTAQVEIGTFVKTEDDEESVLGFATVLQAKEHLPAALASKIGDLASGERVGWIVREAIVNVPSQVTMQILACLKDDLKWAEEQKFAKFDEFLVLAPCYDGEGGQEELAIKEPGGSKKKKKAKIQHEYALSEDFLLANAAKASRVFRVAKPAPKEGVDMPESLEHAPWLCHALLIKRDELFKAIDNLAGMPV